MPSIHERVAAARGRLAAAGIPQTEADRDARLLARTVLGWDAGRFWAAASEAEPDGFHAGYEALIARRLTREPMAYIRGTQEFWGLDFEVSPAVLIPRPETELIVEAALDLCPARTLEMDIADVGTGSGCLAVTLARELPAACLTATDASEAALDVARRNAARHGVDGRIRFVRTDLLAGLDRQFHLIVANPPYVRERDRAGLQPEVRDYEPALALFAGDDGLAIIARLLEQAAVRLRPGGVLIFEFGLGQDDGVQELIARTPGLQALEVKTDLQGLPRTAMVSRARER